MNCIKENIIFFYMLKNFQPKKTYKCFLLNFNIMFLAFSALSHAEGGINEKNVFFIGACTTVVGLEFIEVQEDVIVLNFNETTLYFNDNPLLNEIVNPILFCKHNKKLTKKINNISQTIVNVNSPQEVEDVSISDLEFSNPFLPFSPTAIFRHAHLAVSLTMVKDYHLRVNINRATGLIFYFLKPAQRLEIVIEYNTCFKSQRVTVNQTTRPPPFLI